MSLYEPFYEFKLHESPAKDESSASVLRCSLISIVEEAALSDRRSHEFLQSPTARGAGLVIGFLGKLYLPLFHIQK